MDDVLILDGMVYILESELKRMMKKYYKQNKDRLEKSYDLDEFLDYTFEFVHEILGGEVWLYGVGWFEFNNGRRSIRISEVEFLLKEENIEKARAYFSNNFEFNKYYGRLVIEGNMY